ncbi:hypothetical protein LINPERHAP2_LOCUS15707 [Linum perenne]
MLLALVLAYLIHAADMPLIELLDPIIVHMNQKCGVR